MIAKETTSNVSKKTCFNDRKQLLLLLLFSQHCVSFFIWFFCGCCKIFGHNAQSSKLANEKITTRRDDTTSTTSATSKEKRVFQRFHFHAVNYKESQMQMPTKDHPHHSTVICKVVELHLQLVIDRFLTTAYAA